MRRRVVFVLTVSGLVAAGLTLGPRAVAETTTVGPPYNSDSYAASCWPVTAPCSAQANADKSSGAVSASAEIDGPNTTKGSWSAGSNVGFSAVYDLAAPVDGLQLTANVHLDTARIGHTGGSPASSSQGQIFPEFYANDDACPNGGYGCQAGSSGQTILSTTAGQSADGSGRDYPIQIVMTAPQGQLPAGHITLSVNILAYVELAPGDQGSETMSMAGTIVSFTVKPMSMVKTGSQSKQYVGFVAPEVENGVDNVLGGCASPTGLTPARSGPVIGACFAVDPVTQKFIDFSITDMVRAGPVEGSWSWYDQFGNLTGSQQTFFCGSSGAISIPPNAAYVIVRPTVQGGPPLFLCSQASVATTGTVNANWYTLQ